MTLGVYGVRDKLSGFLTPTFDVNDAVALRNFEAAVLDMRAGNLFHSNPADYDLFRLAHFDSDSGSFSPCDPPEMIISGQAILLRSLSKESGVDAV